MADSPFNGPENATDMQWAQQAQKQQHRTVRHVKVFGVSTNTP